MADLPETDQELLETENQTATGSRMQGYLTGFISGCLTILFFSLVFILGWKAGERGFFGKNHTTGIEQKEASVLTDKDTLAKLDEIQTLIEREYLNKVDGDMLSTYLFKGVAAGLDDPYASYYSVEELQAVKDSNNGVYFGIGILLKQDHDSEKLIVEEVYEDSPAAEAGLLAGDELLAADDEDLTKLSLNDAIALIKSKESSFVFHIYRTDTEEELDITIQCDQVELNYVETEMMDSGIGYLHLTEFTVSAADQFAEGLRSLKEQGMKKLIVDIRNNPGGVLDAVCDVLDTFLDNEMIVYTEDRNGKRKEYMADSEKIWDGETAVLVNGYSASASEIFSGALQDYKLGTIIGTQTYGKGVVQKTYVLSDGSAFKFTAEKYFTPLGQDIDGNGITPDIIVEGAEESEEDLVLKTALDYLSQSST